MNCPIPIVLLGALENRKIIMPGHVAIFLLISLMMRERVDHPFSGVTSHRNSATRTHSKFLLSGGTDHDHGKLSSFCARNRMNDPDCTVWRPRVRQDYAWSRSNDERGRVHQPFSGVTSHSNSATRKDDTVKSVVFWVD
jgi:hypothetical protein